MGCICSNLTGVNPGCPLHGDGGVPLNALGQPSPQRTDFATWERFRLERFARQAADENLVLRNALKQAGVKLPPGM